VCDLPMAGEIKGNRSTGTAGLPVTSWSTLACLQQTTNITGW